MTIRHFKVLLERDPESRVWVTYVPSPKNISTYGDTKEEALEKTTVAILWYFEAVGKEGLSLPLGEFETELVDLEVAVKPLWLPLTAIR